MQLPLLFEAAILTGLTVREKPYFSSPFASYYISRGASTVYGFSPFVCSTQKYYKNITTKARDRWTEWRGNCKSSPAAVSLAGRINGHENYEGEERRTVQLNVAVGWRALRIDRPRLKNRRQPSADSSVSAVISFSQRADIHAPHKIN